MRGERAATRGRRWWAIGIAAGMVLLGGPLVPRSSLLAQDQSARIRGQRDELERIRRERAELERQATEQRASVRDLSEEVRNLDARAAATERIVRTLDAQLDEINAEVAQATRNVTAAEDELHGRRGAMQRRLADIYKRGPTYTFQALLSAHSFGELVARYKYLHLLALHDRAVVSRVEELRDRVGVERSRLVALQGALADNRNDKQLEEERLRDLQRERAVSLVAAQRSAKQTEVRLLRLRRTEAQLGELIASAETARRRAERARPNAPHAASTIATGDYGRLDWPVDGPLLYTFGKAQTASNTTIRWNGVGIQAGIGTPVRAVAAGRVVFVRPLGTYGLTVMVDHGGGDYSIYGSLSRAVVREQERVAKGQSLGTVGASDPDLPPHLHFEIRHRSGAGAEPAAVDPATWLRGDR